MRTIFALLFALLPAAAPAGEAPKAFSAARHIRAGEVISADALKEVPAAPGAQAAAGEELVGMEAVRPIRAGELVTRLMVRPARAVRPGDRISVKAGSGAVSVRMSFTALQGGAAGEIVEARNQASGRVCRVRVEGPGTGSLAEGK